MMWMVCALCDCLAHDLSDYRYMDFDVTGNLFFFIVQHEEQFWKHYFDCEIYLQYVTEVICKIFITRILSFSFWITSILQCVKNNLIFIFEPDWSAISTRHYKLTMLLPSESVDSSVDSSDGAESSLSVV